MSRKLWSPLEGRGAIISPEGDVVWEDPDWIPNALLNEGEESILNVYYREQANPSKYLALITGTPAETDTMAWLAANEIRVPTPVDGYARQQLLAANWGAPALDTGDMQTSHAEISFGPASGSAWSAITGVAVVTAATGQLAGSGKLIQALALTGSQNVSIGFYFRYTLRVKAQ